MSDLLAVFSYRLQDLANATFGQWCIAFAAIGLIWRLIGGKS